MAAASAGQKGQDGADRADGDRDARERNATPTGRLDRDWTDLLQGFRRHQRSEAVKLAHRMAIVGMALLAVAVTGVATLIFDVVVGRAAAITGAVLTFALLTALWAILPLASRGPSTNDEEPQTLLRGFLVLMGCTARAPVWRWGRPAPSGGPRRTGSRPSSWPS